ncbi:MAG: ECF transporter S component [Bacilli bacterium]|nr:ECF transporter S component [Bacilli bacterium]
MNKKVLKITFCGVMAAMAIALNKVLSLQITPSIKITFYALPLMVTGILYGFKIGLLTGLVSGVILQLTSPYGVTITAPVWALAPILWGAIPGLIFKPLNKVNKYLAYAVVVFITSIAANLANTLAMYCDCLFIDDAYYTVASILMDWPGRIVTMLVTMIPYILISFIVCDRLKKIYLFDEEERKEEDEESNN